MSPIELVLRTVGAQNFIRDLSSGGDAARDMGRDMESAGRSAEGAGRAFEGAGQGANRAGAEMGDASRAVERVGDAAQEAGRDMHGAASEAENLGGALGDVGDNNGLDQAGQKAAHLTATLEKARAAGMAITAIGVGGIALSKHFGEVAEEGNAVEARLESILKSQNRLGELDTQNNIIQDVTVRGHYDDDDGIRDATVLLDSFSVKTEHMSSLLESAAVQARTMGTDISGVASSLGKAYTTGKVAPLKKSGVVISPEELKRIEDAYKVSQKLGQQTFVDVLGPAIKNNTVALADSLTETQQKANDAARAWDDFQTNVGTGSNEAESGVHRITFAILEMANTSPEVQKSAGVWLTYGSYAATAAGSVLTVGSQVAITAASMSTLGITSAGVFGAMRIGALSVAASVGLIALAALAAVAAIALAVYSWNVNKEKILNPTDSFKDRRSYGEQTEDSKNIVRLRDLDSKSDDLAPRDRMVLKRKISQGYQDLGETDAAQKTMSEYFQLKGTFPKGFKNVTSAEGKSLAKQLAGLNTGANTSKRLGELDKPKKSDSEREMDSIQAKAAKMKADIEAGTAVKPFAVAPTVAIPVAAPKIKIVAAKVAAKENDSHAPSKVAAKLVRVAEKGHADDLAKLAKSASTIQSARAPLGSTLGVPMASDTSAPSSMMGAAMSTQVDALRWLHQGGSLYNLPSGATGGGSGAASGQSGGSGGAGARTGAMKLRETGRQSNPDGTEKVTVTGTLELSDSGSINGLVMGFKL